MYLLGIDLGTTGCKSMIFDTEGQILGDHYIEYDLIFTPEGIEQSADDWWNHTKTTIIKSIEKAGIQGKDVAALSISSQGISFVPIDRDGKPLMNAISWYDARAHKQADQLRQAYTDLDMAKRTGRRIGSLVFTQVMWLKENRPDVYEKTWKFLMAMDYLVYCLSGETVTDFSMASGTLAFDTVKRQWIQPLFDQYEIDVDKFPRIGCLGEAVGTVQPQVARELGLSDKTVVALGVQDQKGAAIGAGMDDGVITISLGTASAICTLTHEHLVDPAFNLFCHGFDRQRWMLESAVSTAGAAVKWVRNTFFEGLSYAQLDDLANQAPPGSNGVFFHPMLGQKQKGSMSRWSGMTLATSKGELFRSVLEGISYEIAAYIEAHQNLNSDVVGTEAIQVFGGGAASPVWCQILADISGKRVVIPRTRETACLGAAIIAALGAGLMKDLHEGYRLLGPSQAQYLPDPDNHRRYQDIMQDYRRLHAST